MGTKIWIAVGLVLGAAWQVQCQVNCTDSGAGRFPDPSDTTCQNYTFCVYDTTAATYLSYNYVCPTTSLFNPNTQQCTTNYVCNVTTSTTNTTNTTTSACTEDGYIADPNVTDCSSYIQCVKIDGEFIETPYTCSNNTFYNPNSTLCETTYSCPVATIPPFTCKAAGRFANTTDTTCQTYFLCVLTTDGTYIQYNYTCPSTSVFNPTARLCTTAYTCTG